ncbi:hypothetical protein ECZU22_19130 [Escherichia coli]|nr:hypothetical protein ECZU22_19130 [Escherichia coli]
MLNETPALAPDGQPYRLLTLRNNAGMVVTLMDWGATLLSARIPLSDGSVREALLLRQPGMLSGSGRISGGLYWSLCQPHRQ